MKYHTKEDVIRDLAEFRKGEAVVYQTSPVKDLVIHAIATVKSFTVVQHHQKERFPQRLWELQVYYVFIFCYYRSIITQCFFQSLVVCLRPCF